MWSTAREIAPGDLVIIWLTRDVIQPLLITPGKDFNSKYGHYRHADLIGIPYGSKVGSHKGKGFIHVLRPTPELWTMALPHRTQILYLADIAFITSYLNIKRGSRVIEAGTGSGSFSHSITRTIGTSGHLWSYEFHEARAAKAKEEFAQHGMDDIVTLTHRNVCKDGFAVTDTVDAVFLDLPAPWEAVDHAKQALRKDTTTRICCFSPCMEQVMRTVNALNEAGFTEITMYEALVRAHDVSHVPVLTPICEISEKLKQAERKREDKRLKQIATNRATKRKREGEGDLHDQEQRHDAAEADESSGSKRVKKDDEDTSITDTHAPDTERQMMDVEPRADASTSVSTDGTTGISVTSTTSTSTLPTSSPSFVPATKMSVSKAFSEVRGHTSYLTFACLQPFPPAAVKSSTEVEIA